MGNCKCKGKKKQQVVAPQPIDMLVGFELINKSVIREQQINSNERQILYTFYNEQFNENVMVTCRTCWDGFVKEKLRILWTEKNLESLQK
jgi:hypothetical protein